MKKVILLLIAVVALASCSNETPITQPKAQESEAVSLTLEAARRPGSIEVCSHDSGDLSAFVTEDQYGNYFFTFVIEPEGATLTKKLDGLEQASEICSVLANGNQHRQAKSVLNLYNAKKTLDASRPVEGSTLCEGKTEGGGSYSVRVDRYGNYYMYHKGANADFVEVFHVDNLKVADSICLGNYGSIYSRANTEFSIFHNMEGFEFLGFITKK